MATAEIAPAKRAGNKVFAARKVFARSRISNGRELLDGIDGRSAVARRFRDIVASLASDQGGHEQMSEARLQLIRRFAAACVLCEQLETRLVNGEAVEIAEHAQLASTLVRISQRIGVDRVARDITPTLEQYLRAKETAE